MSFRRGSAASNAGLRSGSKWVPKSPSTWRTASSHGSAEAKGRSLIVGDAFDTVPAGAAFAEAFGGTVGLVSKANLLETDTIDWDMIQRWSAQGSERAPGYEVFTVLRKD